MPTRASADATLTGLCGPVLAAARVVLTPTGDPPHVPAFDLPIAWALALSGFPAVDPSNPTDADLALPPASLWMQLVDLAELRSLETAAQALAAQVKIRKLPDVDLERDANALTALIQAKRQWIKDQYGIGVSSLSAGVIRVHTRRCRSEF